MTSTSSTRPRRACTTSTSAAATTSPPTEPSPSRFCTSGPTCPTSCGRTGPSWGALTYLTEQGIDQFLDLGSGIPTAGNVHEIVSRLNPAARTVYADNDLVAVSHSRSILAGTPNAVAMHTDLRDPAAVFGDPALLGLLDLDRPVGVLMFAVLHFVSADDDPAGILRAYRDGTVPGSYLAISHATADYQPERMGDMQDVYRRATAGMNPRSREELTALLTTAGYDLIPPGVTDMIHWRPDPGHELGDPLGGDLARYSAYAAVGFRS